MKTTFLYLIILVLFAISCRELGEDEQNNRWTYQVLNSTEYDVRLVFKERQTFENKKFNIQKKQKISTFKGSSHFAPGPLLMHTYDSVFIYFEETHLLKRVLHDDLENNILAADTYVEDGMSGDRILFLHTITDEDYANAEPIE